VTAPPVDFREKVELAVGDVAGRGVWRSTAAPFPYRILWWLGLRIRPPHFQGFPALVALNGLTVALSFALPVAAVLVVRNGPDYFPSKLFNVLMMTSGVFGLACGLGLAAFYRLSARRLGLPGWEVYDDLPGHDAGW
jgi:hypothetical protein